MTVTNSDVSNAPLIVDISPAASIGSEPSVILSSRPSSSDSTTSLLSIPKLNTEPISKSVRDLFIFFLLLQFLIFLD